VQSPAANDGQSCRKAVRIPPFPYQISRKNSRSAYYQNHCSVDHTGPIMKRFPQHGVSERPRKPIGRILIFALVAAAPVAAAPGDPQTLSECAQLNEQHAKALEEDQSNWMPFPEQKRVLAPPEVLERGKGMYTVNCAVCHAADLRGGGARGGPNLLRSAAALNDQHGELILPIVRGARQEQGMPAFSLPDADVIAVAEYIHSVQAQLGMQGRPPGSDKVPELRVIVGNPRAGSRYFKANCTGCHSITGDLKRIGAKYTEPRTLQNIWVSGNNASRTSLADLLPPSESLRGCQAPKPTVVVTLANGEKLRGMLVEENDFVVTLVGHDGARRTITRNADVAGVEIHDPNEAHRKLALSLALSPDDKAMHDVTAYLATLK
jgi:cytochrome c oxidase cbb3-type subunit III